jgi:hypothetical protein
MMVGCFQHYRNQRRVAAIRFEVPQVLCGHLAALASQLQQPILVNLMPSAFREMQCLDGFEAINVLKQMLGGWAPGGCRNQIRLVTLESARIKGYQAPAMIAIETGGEQGEDDSICAGDGLSAHALDDSNQWQDDLFSENLPDTQKHEQLL